MVTQLLARGRVARPYIGIKMLQLTRANALLLAARDPTGFPAGVAGGVLVPHVAPRSPAARAGLRPGDVIVGHGGESEQATTSGLVAALAAQVGQPLALRVRRPRQDAELTLHVVASEVQP